jgi:threonine dehydratase
MRRVRVRSNELGVRLCRTRAAGTCGAPQRLSVTCYAAVSAGLGGRRTRGGGRRRASGSNLAIGRTPVFASPELSDYFGIKHLAVKDESANCFGTHKDRKSLHVALNVVATPAHERPEGLCILTAGNAGLSLATIASAYGLGVTSFISDDSTDAALRAQLEAACERVIPLDLKGHHWLSTELAHKAGADQGRRVLDVTNGVIEPFETLVDEICDLGAEQVPDVIVSPVGGGELFIGLARGIERRGLRTRLVGVTVCEESAADKLYSHWKPTDDYIKSLTGAGSPHILRCLKDEQLLRDTYEWLKAETNIACEPSSAAAFAILRQVKDCLRPREEKVMVINTGTFKTVQRAF